MLNSLMVPLGTTNEEDRRKILLDSSNVEFGTTLNDDRRVAVITIGKWVASNLGSYSHLGYSEESKNLHDCTFDTLPKFGPEHQSLMSKYLTEELFHQLKDKKSSKRYTLSNVVIQAGLVLPHLMCGATAGDESCWDIFKELYYPIIYSWHGFDAYTQEHDSSRADLDPSKLKVSADQVSLFNQHVVSTRIRAARNIRGFALPPGATDDQTFAAFL